MWAKRKNCFHDSTKIRPAADCMAAENGQTHYSELTRKSSENVMDYAASKRYAGQRRLRNSKYCTPRRIKIVKVCILSEVAHTNMGAKSGLCGNHLMHFLSNNAHLHSNTREHRLQHNR